MVGSKVYIVLSLIARTFFWRISMEKTGFYIIKDNFFDIVNDPFLKGNKKLYEKLQMKL